MSPWTPFYASACGSCFSGDQASSRSSVHVSHCPLKMGFGAREHSVCAPGPSKGRHADTASGVPEKPSPSSGQFAHFHQRAGAHRQPRPRRAGLREDHHVPAKVPEITLAVPDLPPCFIANCVRSAPIPLAASGFGLPNPFFALRLSLVLIRESYHRFIRHTHAPRPHAA